MKNFVKYISLFTAMLLISWGSMAQQPAVKKISTKEKTEQKSAQKEAKPLILPVQTASDQTTDKSLSDSYDWSVPASKLVFMQLPYEYDALEPVIDKLTVEIHYSKHHRAYFDNLQKAISGTAMEKMNIYEIFFKMSELPAAVRNNAGGYYNHALYWNNMTSKGSEGPDGELAKAINKYFDGIDNFKKQFDDAAKARFGSGWAWLAIDIKTGELFVTSTANQDNPLMNTESRRGFPILGIDVWEHAYYLKYQNKRADYVQSFWKIVNWNDVEARYNRYMKEKENIFGK